LKDVPQRDLDLAGYGIVASHPDGSWDPKRAYYTAAAEYGGGQPHKATPCEPSRCDGRPPHNPGNDTGRVAERRLGLKPRIAIVLTGTSVSWLLIVYLNTTLFTGGTPTGVRLLNATLTSCSQ